MHTAQVKVTLSPEALQQIFAEKPYIHRAFTALVPSKLSERDFWEKYFNFELAKKVAHALPGAHHCLLSAKEMQVD